jgi:myo-inositol-1(or 4)-monophosphatase
MSGQLKIIEKAILKAGRILSRDFGELENLQVSKKGPGDFVTSSDLKVEKVLVEELQKSFPEYSYRSEENYDVKGSDDQYLFVIDPIDGTTNFMHGNPFFCISIALLKKNLQGKFEPYIGVIYAPATADLYYAEKGEGAYLNNRRINVSSRKSFSECLFASYISRNDIETRKKDLDSLQEMNAHSRIMGSAALELAYVASGKLDGMWHNNLKIWDIAAGVLIVQEARGMVSEVNGGSNFLKSGNIIAANGEVFDKLRKKISKIYK